MKKHVYIFGNASTDNHRKITDQWRWDSVRKWQKIREAVWKIWGDVIKIIASSESRVIQTADYIADWMHLRNYSMQILHDLAKDEDFDNNIVDILASINEFIAQNILTIIIVHKRNIAKIKDKLLVDWEYINEPCVLGWCHIVVEK